MNKLKSSLGVFELINRLKFLQNETCPVEVVEGFNLGFDQKTAHVKELCRNCKSVLRNRCGLLSHFQYDNVTQSNTDSASPLAAKIIEISVGKLDVSCHLIFQRLQQK